MQGWGSMDGVWDGSFLEWVGRSQLYSADLLSPDAAKDLEQWMQYAAPADKRHMMALLRDLHATVTPTGYDCPALFCTLVLATLGDASGCAGPICVCDLHASFSPTRCYGPAFCLYRLLPNMLSLSLT